MGFPTTVRRAKAVSSTTNATSFTPSWSYTGGTNTAISAGDDVLWVCIVSADGNPTLSVNAANSDAGWSKDSQASDGTVAVTGAVFTCHTTSSFAASAQPALQIDSSATEQFSAVLLAFKAASGKVATYLRTNAAATGSSTNSDPPQITFTGADQTVGATLVVSRSGDSTVVATVAPTGLSYTLVSQAGGGTNGASTNTADAIINFGTTPATYDPTAFTSATEQWVSFSVAVYEASSSFSQAPGIATETDSSLGLGLARSAGASSEADAALALAAKQIRAAGVAGGANTALALAVALKSGVAGETDASLGLGLARPAGLAAETDTIVASIGRAVRSVGLSVEVDAAQALGSARPAALTTEADSALARAVIAIRPAGLATEVDAASQLLQGGASGSVGIGNETDIGIARGVARPLGLVAETDTSASLSRGTIKTLGLTSEADDAIGRSMVVIRGVGLANETDTAFARAIGQTASAGVANETDIVLARGAALAISFAASTDSALTLVAALPAPVPDSRTIQVGKVRSILTISAGRSAVSVEGRPTHSVQPRQRTVSARGARWRG